MDERLEKALEFSNYMITLNNQRKLIQEKFQEQSIHYYNGGKFAVTRDLIAFIQSLISLNQTSTILIDDNDIPVEVDDLQQFATDLYSTYFEAANTYLTEYNNIKKNRSVEGLINL